MSQDKKVLTEPISINNPITIQVLGICSALAVTSKIQPSLVMGLAVVIVMTFSSVIVSLMRNYIPSKVRIIIEMTVVAAMVILVDQVLKAYAFEVSKQLSIFVGLIITNCIVLGRLEAFALSNKPWPSFLDALGNGIGYAFIIVLVGFIREILGSGTLFGGTSIELKVIPEAVYSMGYANNGLMLLAPGAFIILGFIIWVQRSITGYREE
ncbi:MAG: NADH:ubiquinone reductase (Na(+)-transporting) subunit D [Bacteroidales bacterium]|jgi:Na+-transporting NADH:ubiquinone oxidoreductase subunit D|nr:NADH:ubiquinone reductase (Na(+)-transporting) subunit D [Bacteroidales bacterium]